MLPNVQISGKTSRSFREKQQMKPLHKNGQNYARLLYMYPTVKFLYMYLLLQPIDYTKRTITHGI